MLIICGDTIDRKHSIFTEFSYNSFFNQYGKKFSDKAEELKSRKVVQVGKNDHPVLYVMQREFATITSEGNINMIGTDMMTTCHAVILTTSNVTSVGHFDGSKTSQGIKQLVQSFIKASQQFPDEEVKLHLVGGFLDDERTSQKLSMGILKSFVEVCDENQLNVKLDSYVCTGLNTCSKNVTTKNPPGIRNVTTASSRNVACPCVYGVAVHKGEIHPASFSDVTKGPLQDLRGAYSLYGSGNMLNIYNTESKQIEIGPFKMQQVNYVTYLLQQTDEWILRNMSTSPEVEPDNFVHHIRASLQFIVGNPHFNRKYFVDDQPVRFRFSGDDWVES